MAKAPGRKNGSAVTVTAGSHTEIKRYEVTWDIRQHLNIRKCMSCANHGLYEKSLPKETD